MDVKPVVGGSHSVRLFEDPVYPTVVQKEVCHLHRKVEILPSGRVRFCWG
jgi:hypothetical protein